MQWKNRIKGGKRDRDKHTHDRVETITNSWENREGKQGEHEQRLCHAFVELLTIQEIQDGRGWGVLWVRGDGRARRARNGNWRMNVWSPKFQKRVQ